LAAILTNIDENPVNYLISVGTVKCEKDNLVAAETGKAMYSAYIV